MARTANPIRPTVTTKRMAQATVDRTINPRIIGKTPRETINQIWAPLWFYSALAWLGKPFYDRNNVRQQFGDYVVGSDVDPYQALGSTRLFLIALVEGGFRLSVAADMNSVAGAGEGDVFSATDAGIRDMYNVLAQSPVFSSVRYCYVPARVGPDLDPQQGPVGTGYDPDSGLRVLAMGSAVSQLIPADEFPATRNVPAFLNRPAIVPLVCAFVYDLAKYNVPGATTFTIPAFYSRDRISPGLDFVNRTDGAAVFQGGPGYTADAATPLKLQTLAVLSAPDHAFSTYTFAEAVVTTTATVGPSVDKGVSELICRAASFAEIFKAQSLVGFYRENGWKNCSGIPIWDFGAENKRFEATIGKAAAPTLVYDPSKTALTGGSLQTALAALRKAKYLCGPDLLLARLLGQPNTGRGGTRLVTNAATLSFDRGGIDAIADQLDVPLVAVIQPPARPPVPGVRAPRGKAKKSPISKLLAPGESLIGASANTQRQPASAAGPVEITLKGWIPAEALEGTGITLIEPDTVFPEQMLGGKTGAAPGTILNLMERHDVPAPLAPVDLDPASLGMPLKAGVTYIFALDGQTLKVRGSDRSHYSSTLKTPATKVPFIGAAMLSPGGKVRLFPKLQLTAAAPGPGSSGVQAGVSYAVRMKFANKNATVDLIDDTGNTVASGVKVGAPKVAGPATPQPGDIYLGSFTGGDKNMTLWSVPVFTTVDASALGGPLSEEGATLVAKTSDLPTVQLKVTDSSLFVFTEMTIETGAVGTSGDVFPGCAVLNSAPASLSPTAFAPNKVLIGLVRRAAVGPSLEYVFIPYDDSIVIGGTRYAVTIMEISALDFDPSDRPYPPTAWPTSRFWQFANKHDPYLAVGYEGPSQEKRTKRAEQDTAAIGSATAEAAEPIHLYLDTYRETGRIWPITPFALDAGRTDIDRSAMSLMLNAVTELFATVDVGGASRVSGNTNASEAIRISDELVQANPFEFSRATAASAAVSLISQADRPAAPLKGRTVLDLALDAPPLMQTDSLAQVESAKQRTAERQDAVRSIDKASVALQVETSGLSQLVGIIGPGRTQKPPLPAPIFGFSLLASGGREAFLVELVQADQDIPDQLPSPTRNLNYDPYYVRVVFLHRMISYNMSIIVPAIAHDQYGHFARKGVLYGNPVSQTNELKLGYVHSLIPPASRADELAFGAFPYPQEDWDTGGVIFTNVPYSSSLSVPTAVLARYAPTPYFACRRHNWSADCHLMRSSHGLRSIAYMAFGAGDLIPLRLDSAFHVDKRAPAHLYKLTYTFSDSEYQSAKSVSIANTPYVVALTIDQTGMPRYNQASIKATAGTTDLAMTPSQQLVFPREIYAVGQASATLISVDDLNASFGTGLVSTGDIVTVDDGGTPLDQEFSLITYNNLLYLIRAVSNFPALRGVGDLASPSGLLIDTFVPTPAGTLALAQAARHKRSEMQFFGATYTPTTMVDTLDNLDFASITGEVFQVPTIFIPIPELDASKGFVADISNFLGQQFWTFIYPEIVARPGESRNGLSWPAGLNLDSDNKPVLSLQKLHFVYDPLVTLFTPNDLSHKYSLQPKQQVLALTNGQVREGLRWRSASVLPHRLAPHIVRAQEIIPTGPDMDAPNIIYSPHNRPVATPAAPNYLGMSVNSFVGVSGTVYAIEESALANDQTGTSLVSAVSSTTNMALAVLFDYDNNELGTLQPYDEQQSSKGVVFLNGYLGATGYNFSSPDHFDVNDVLPSQVPLIEQIADTLGQDVAYHNTDVSLPRQFWSLTFDTLTAAGAGNYIPDVPPSLADPTFSNRTRSLMLNFENPVRPQQVGLMDTYSSVVSAGFHLQNGVTASIFLSKKADRDSASLGTNPSGPNTTPLYGLPTKYDFFLFSRDHYWTLKGASFELIDHGYAMCLVDDGTGTGGKVAKYVIDAAGNYNELFSYALYSPNGGIIEASTFTLRVNLGSPGNLASSPILPATPNNVNPQDLVAQINRNSNLVYAAFGPASPGQAPAFLPIQGAAGSVQAAPVVGAPGFNGYALNVVTATRQPLQISQIYSGATAYPIAGSTATIPVNPRTGRPGSLVGSISHGLDRLLPSTVQSPDGTSSIPRTTVPPGPATGLFGGNGLGGLIGTPLSLAFQGSGAVPPAVAGGPPPGTRMKADDGVFYTYNAVSNSVMDSTGRTASPSAGQYFIDNSDPSNPITGIVTLPRFTLNGNSYSVILSTTLTDGITPRYTLLVGGKSYPFDNDNIHVTVDRTRFTFNPIKAGSYTVSYAALDAPAGDQAPSPIPLTPFSAAMGGSTVIIDVFNNPAAMNNIVFGVTGRTYDYDPVLGKVTIHDGPAKAVVPLSTGSVFASSSGYGYVIAYTDGRYTANGTEMFPYSAILAAAPPAHALMTAPQMFTVDSSFYTFDRDGSGNYLTVTGNQRTVPINPYQFSLNGRVYILDTNAQPNLVIGGGSSSVMTAGNSQFLLNGTQYTITVRQGSLNGATISGQFEISQGNVIAVENYIYALDTLNSRIVGNGSAYPISARGTTYTIQSTDRSFTVTTARSAVTVTIAGIVHEIGNRTVTADGIVYPILEYRTFEDGPDKFVIGIDGTVSSPVAIALVGSAPFIKAKFTDAGKTYTVNDVAAFDGANLYLLTGTPPQFTAGGRVYTLRNDGAFVAAGATKTYLGKTSGPLSPTQFTFGTVTIFFNRPTDLAAFDGTHYFAIAGNQFTDTVTGDSYTLSGNTAVHDGNSYEIFSNLGQGAFFEVPGGRTYYVNIPVADTGSANGDVFSVFPISGNQFSIPLRYTITIAGGVASVNAITFGGGATPQPGLTVAGGALTGGFFTDPVTKITYTCQVDGSVITFVDSNNAAYAFPAPGTAGDFIASVSVTTGVSVAVDDQAVPAVYPVQSSQFVAGAATYQVNVPVAYENAAGPYFRMTNGRFIVPRADPLSSLAYTVRGGSVTAGWVVSADDQFSVDGHVVYTVNAVNVQRATDQAKLTGAPPIQTLKDGPLTYTLDDNNGTASVQLPGVTYDTGTKSFSVVINGTSVTYKIGGQAKDNRQPQNAFPLTSAGTQRTFTDSVAGITFTFDISGPNPVTAQFTYTNGFFTDAVTGFTYYIDQAGPSVEALSYLPETTHYAFSGADGKTYLIHYDDVRVVFPVVAGKDVNAGSTTIGSNSFTIEIDEVAASAGGPAIPVNRNSFEINGNLYTITGTPTGKDYSACTVVGEGQPPHPFLSKNTFQLDDGSVTYTLELDGDNLPEAITASFPVQPSRDLLTINDDVYVLTYSSVSSGSLQGQGQAAIPIVNSAFTLSNRFDSTRAKFIFADADIYNASTVVGQFTVYLAPTFTLSGVTYTFDPVQLLVSDPDKRTYPLLANPTMFSINGFNYVLDTNHTPHAVVGNSQVSPIATDVTVEAGHPIANTTFTLGGLIYRYVEDGAHNLLAVRGTKSYMIQQPGLTFKLDSSLVLTLNPVPPAAGNFAGTTVPIGTITAPGLVLNLYAGTPESGNDDFFTYKNILYTVERSGGVPVAVQKTYTVYAAQPSATQQQLAVFNLNGTTIMATDGSTAGDPAAGINPGTQWAATATSAVESQFGLVFGLLAQPITVTRSGAGVFQFIAPDASGTTTLYDILYSSGGSANVVKADVPALLPTFTQVAPFTFVPSYPLTLETGGYNAFTTFVAETSTPSLSFAGAYKRPITSTDPLIDTLMSDSGDFSLAFWHSLPSSAPIAYHPFTYRANNALPPLVYQVDMDFEDDSNIFVAINGTTLQATATPPVFSSSWRHVALVYRQPYTMFCEGAGFEVKKGDNYNFNRDFSVAMTFSASDVTTEQGLLYKGTASTTTAPENRFSYRVGVSGGNVTLDFSDGENAASPVFQGPPIQAETFYQLVIVKQSVTRGSSQDNPDPYAAPFDTSDLGKLNSGGMSGNTSGFPSGSGSVTISNVAPAASGASTNLTKFLTSLGSPPPKKYRVTISVRVVKDDGTFGDWVSVAQEHDAGTNDAALAILSTGAAHLLIGTAFSNNATALPLGNTSGASGSIREVYLFNGAIDRTGVKREDGTTADIGSATAEELTKAGLIGHWVARYDPNGFISNPLDSDAVAISTNLSQAYLSPLAGKEREGASLYVNGVAMTLSLVSGSSVPASLQSPFSPGSRQLLFNAGAYRMSEISLWRMARQPYQIVDDMFGRLVPTNEPLLLLYLSGSFEVQPINAPILPLSKYVDNIAVSNPVTAMPVKLSNSSIDLAGCPAVGRCGPLITPNFYTPPGVALTVADTVPALATYSVTLNTLTAGLAGEIQEAYVYVKDHVLTFYAGKKIGDLVLTWVSQEQGDVQLIGYIEGAPPAPMANLTNKTSYAGATSITFSAPTSITLKLQRNEDNSTDNKIDFSIAAGVNFDLGIHIAPFGAGVTTDKTLLSLLLNIGGSYSSTWSDAKGTQLTATNKLDESNRYTVKLQGTLMPPTGDSFMASLNSQSVASATAGTAPSRVAILPNPNLGGFTSANPAAALPRVPFDEKFGVRMFQPSPYGQAFVTSQTLDVYQQTLIQTNTVYGFVRIPNAQIPRDINIVSFRINSAYLRPGVIDGVIGYAYNPATLPGGAQTYSTSTGEMQVLYDKNFSSSLIGHDASYMRIVEAYKVKRQIDQQAFNALALYHAQYDAKGLPNDSRLTPGLDFYNEYVWTCRGGTQEVKHTYTTSYDEVYSTTSGTTVAWGLNFNLKLGTSAITIADLKFAYTNTSKQSIKYSYNTTGTSSFDITASFDGIESDTQMRYASNNDAHFVMKNNSTFNSGNQSGLNLVIGSDGLVYDIVPNVSSGAGIPSSNNIDDSQTYSQPQPSYSSGNASGLTGALEPYDRPGKVKQFRAYAFFLQPSEENADNFWNEVVDPVWLANSDEADARALRSSQSNRSVPWRTFYRVTYCERFLPPVSTDAIVVPQITPVLAVPVLDSASDFLFKALAAPGPRPLHNPANDLEANVVLAAPTASGASAGSLATSGPNIGQPILPNNVIPFDLMKNSASLVSWGDSPNARLLSQLTMSVLGTNVVPMATRAVPGSTKLYDVLEPASGAPLYGVYQDPNGFTVNVPLRQGLTVYQDANGNPVQYYDGKEFHSLQADYVATTDGTITYFIEPPQGYDSSRFDLNGDYDLFGKPGDQWRYYLVSGMSANLTAEPTVTGQGAFLASAEYAGLRIAPVRQSGGTNQVAGFVLVQGTMEWPHLNAAAETLADVQVYKSMSLFDTFPIGDPEVLVSFLEGQYPAAPFAGNPDICTVFARNITTYFSGLQQSLIPQ